MTRTKPSTRKNQFRREQQTGDLSESVEVALVGGGTCEARQQFPASYGPPTQRAVMPMLANSSTWRRRFFHMTEPPCECQLYPCNKVLSATGQSVRPGPDLAHFGPSVVQRCLSGLQYNSRMQDGRCWSVWIELLTSRMNFLQTAGNGFSAPNWAMIYQSEWNRGRLVVRSRPSSTAFTTRSGR
jgi:hypothetical protein